MTSSYVTRHPFVWTYFRRHWRGFFSRIFSSILRSSHHPWHDHSCGPTIVVACDPFRSIFVRPRSLNLPLPPFPHPFIPMLTPFLFLTPKSHFIPPSSSCPSSPISMIVFAIPLFFFISTNIHNIPSSPSVPHSSSCLFPLSANVLSTS